MTAPAAAAAPSGVTVRTLGGFEVLVDGSTIPISAWQSKKARDLLKLLVVHRGYPVPREVLVEALWGDADDVDGTRLANRFCVALSTLRSVLGRTRTGVDAPSPINAEAGCVALDRSVVDVDVERFLCHARAGRLEAALAAYGGEFLPEDMYCDWSTALREEARLAYVSVGLRLAASAAAAGDSSSTVEFCLRVLEADPYDDAGHRMLVAALAAAGRHGDARRSYDRFVARLAELGLPAPAYSEVTRLVPCEARARSVCRA